MKKDVLKTISFLGLPGSYSFMAAEKYFGGRCRFLCANSFEAVLQNIESGQAEAAILPLENSLTGGILQNYDLLICANVQIIGEVILKIKHCLLVKNGVTEKFINCYSHPEAIKQCQKFLRFKNLKPVLVSSTAEAARKLTEDKKGNSCAIASRCAAQIYGLKIASDNIADNPHNFTRFLVLGSAKGQKGNKVSLLFSLKHVPGSLWKALEPYAKHGLNLTKIESRPVFGKPWEYLFFVDFELDANLKDLKIVLQEMQSRVNFLKVLGIYEKGETYET